VWKLYVPVSEQANPKSVQSAAEERLRSRKSQLEKRIELVLRLQIGHLLPRALLVSVPTASVISV